MISKSARAKIAQMVLGVVHGSSDASPDFGAPTLR
ncbi:hypothetical protein EVAR_37828_1, partial [Eumeta japonica]